MQSPVKNRLLARWQEYLVAILLGNVVYFLLLEPFLPDRFRHQPFHLDLGWAMDFLVCVAVYGLLRLFLKIWGRS